MLQDWSAAPAFRGFGGPPFETVPCFKCLKLRCGFRSKYTEVWQQQAGCMCPAAGQSAVLDGLDRGVMPSAHRTSSFLCCIAPSTGKAGVKSSDPVRRLRPVLAYSNQDLPCSIHFFKQLLYRQGVYTTPRIRQPLEYPVDTARCNAMIDLAQDIENSCSF